MTKKHFIAIAANLDANRAPLALVLDLADEFEGFNPNFDRAQFVEASTLNLRDEAASTLFTISVEGVS